MYWFLRVYGRVYIELKIQNEKQDLGFRFFFWYTKSSFPPGDSAIYSKLTFNGVITLLSHKTAKYKNEKNPATKHI